MDEGGGMRDEKKMRLREKSLISSLIPPPSSLIMSS
jgi:hypothetical protein